MKKFIAFFASRHVIANLFTLMVIILGVGTLTQIKRDIFPEVDLGEMIITTRYPGASPKDVELNVTNEIEEELQTVSGIDQMTSYSMEEMSVINVTISVDADNKEEIKDEVRRAVDRVTDLPEEVREAPRVVEIDSREFPIIEVGVSGDIPYRDLREIARIFKKRLENLSGVAQVNEYWYRDREVTIQVDPDAMERYQLPLIEIAQAIQNRNIRSTGGTFESYQSEKSVVTLAQFDNPEATEDVVVRTTFQGPAIKVRDLAEVVDGFEDPNVIARINGIPAITFEVEKKSDADIIRTVEEIKQLAAREEERLEEDVKILFTNDQSFYVQNRFDVVLTNGAIGLGLVIIILSIFLSLRTAFWVALGIPVVLLGVIFLLPVTGHFLDVISLAAMLLVIGIIVDDAIIISENIVRKREEGLEPLDAASTGVDLVAKPVITTLLTTFLAFAPMFFMQGVVGEFVSVIPLVISLALFVSLLEITIALPGHLVPGLRKIDGRRRGARHWFRSVRNLFEKFVYYILKLRYVFLVFSVALFVGTIYYAVNYMQFILFPEEAADTFSIYAELPTGSSIQKTADKLKGIEAFIAELPETEVESYATRIGSFGQREPGESDNRAFIRVNLTPISQRDRTAPEIVQVLREKTDTLSGFKDILYVVDAGGPPVGDPITIRIVGADDDVRRALTDSVLAYLNSIDGVVDLDRNDRLGKEQVQIELDYEEVSRLGLSVADVARTVRIAYDGQIVTSVRYGEEDVDFRVILDESARTDTDFLERLDIANRQNRLIPLGQIATFSVQPGPARVYHYDSERATTITGDIAGETPTPVQVTNQVLNHFDLSEKFENMRFVIGGEAEETEESFQSLYIAFAVAVIAIYFLLILLFNSPTQPLTVLVAIPFGIISVILAFALHGEPLGFMAMMGLVGLSGVVVNDSLVMVDHIDNLLASEKKPLIHIVAQGAADRLRAIVMTTLTTVVGLVPLAYGIGGSDPFIAPMALALGYGILFATPLTLLLVPSLYLIRKDILGLLTRMKNFVLRLVGRKKSDDKNN